MMRTTSYHAVPVRSRPVRLALLLVLLLTLAAGSTWVAHAFSNPFALSSLDGSNGFVLNGIDGMDESGISVSGAGDVNSDGVDDLLIGANRADPNGTSDAGESYVVFGSDQGFSPSLNLGSLNGSNGFVLNGIDADDNFGISVSGAGDVNGDGIADLIIGAQYADPNGTTAAGESYVVFGSDQGFSPSLNLSSLNGSNGFVLNGIDEKDNSGYSVSGAGDVNDDGVDDLIIGAYLADPNGISGAGESYVVFGGSGVGSSGSLNLSSLNGSNGFVLTGIDADDNSGSSVSGAGDVNGDGVDDLLIGAYVADPNGFSSGESYVVFGSSGVGSSGSLNLSSLNGSNGFVLNGIDGGDRSGVSVSGAGDVNGDTFDDLLIGAHRADPNGTSSGESYVVFGGSGVGSSGSLNLSSLNGTNGFVLNGIDGGDISGVSVSGAGDVNGDTFDDLLIGAYLADPNGTSTAGESYVVFGSDQGFSPSLNLSSLDGTNGFVLNGIDPGDYSGSSVSGAGDVNGDGVDDLIIGAKYADPNSTSSGESYVVFGRRDTTPPTVSIGSPSESLTQSGPVSFPVTISEADSITLKASDVTLTSVDGISGDISVSNGGTATPTITVNNLSGDGSFTISIAAGVASDNAGNTTASVTSASVTVDNTAPTVSITDAPANLTNATSASFSFTGSDNNGIAAYECQLDSGPWAACTSPQSYNSLSDGAHTFAVRATDNVGNTGNATSQSWTVDTIPPTVTIEQGATQADPASTAPLVFDVTFSEDVNGFEDSDILFGGTASGSLSASVSGGPRAYTVAVSGMTSVGTVTATIAANAATDAAGNANTAATSTDNEVTFDPDHPIITGITRADATPTDAAQVRFTVTIVESVTGVDASDFRLTTTGNLTGTAIDMVTGSDASYTVTVGTGSGEGTLRLDVKDDDTIVDRGGNPLGGTGAGNGDYTASEVYTIDTTAPTVALTTDASDPTSSPSFVVTITFSEPVEGFDTSDLNVTNGTIGTLTPVTPDQVWTVVVTASAEGPVTVTIAEDAATDTLGHGLSNAASLSITYTADARMLYLPLVQRGAPAQVADVAPDLVGSISLNPDQRRFAAGAPVEVIVTVTNVGDAPTDAGFWVDLYLNPAEVPALHQTWDDLCGVVPCHGIVWDVTEPLEPGDTLTLTSTAASYAPDHTRWPGWLAAGTTDMYLLVDSWHCTPDETRCVASGAVAEQDEANNRAHLGGLTVTGENPPAALDIETPVPARRLLPR